MTKSKIKFYITSTKIKFPAWILKSCPGGAWGLGSGILTFLELSNIMLINLRAILPAVGRAVVCRDRQNNDFWGFVFFWQKKNVFNKLFLKFLEH